MPTGPNSKSRKAKPDATELVQIEKGSENVFDDLSLPNPDVVLAKAELVFRIRGFIEKRKLTQSKAAELLGLDQPKLSKLLRGQTEGYSIERLFKLLNALGQRVEISIVPNDEKKESRAVVVTA